MEFKIFGKSLFEINKNKGNQFVELARNSVRESKYLPDFYKNQPQGSSWPTTYQAYVLPDTGTITLPQVSISNTTPKVPKELPEKPKSEKKFSPKDVYNMKMLNDKSFQLNTDSEYIDQQISEIKDKLGLVTAEEFDMQHAVEELSSILIRLENRKKYGSVKSFFEEYPYTTTNKIQELIAAHDYLQIGKSAQFVPDLPREAVSVIKEYNRYTDKLCGKQAVFYIIGDNKDFQKTNNRKDPILLAQSPFGHFWQILGAWDKEMLLLEDL